MVTGRLHTREDSGIVLDREGRWRHDGEPIEHPRIIEAFNRGLEPTDDGRFILRFGRDWCFVQVEDCAYQAERLAFEGGTVTAWLSDATEEPLDLPSLCAAADGSLRCRVKRGRAWARFSRHAQFQLGDRAEADAEGFFLRVGGRVLRLNIPVSAA
jgi:uncharacterized protein